MCGNYRPISDLPTPGKLLERVTDNQCQSYLTQYDLLSDAQSGFGEGRSTGTCLIDFLTEIYEEVDAGGASGVLFLDLAKAFDTVDHEVLFSKLRHLGFKLSSINWFMSYLNNRTQATKVGNSLSSWEQINCGVPQGSILGPLLLSATSMTCLIT